jgi:predicted dehydrogenase
VYPGLCVPSLSSDDARRRTPGLRTIHAGVGGRGRWPVELLTDDPRFTPVALVDVVPENLAWARQRTGLEESACFDDLQVALRNVESDALVICTPTQFHAAMCRAGFAAEKHVLVEKGMTPDFTDATALVEEAEAAGVRFCVSQNWRYLDQTRTLRQALESGRYGRPYVIDLVQHRHRPEPRTLDYPGAVIWDMGCHNFDNLVSLFGPAARATAAMYTVPWSAYRDDAGVIGAIEFASGPVCSYVLTHHATVSEHRWTLQSELGALRSVGRTDWEWVPRGAIKPFAAAGPPEPVAAAAPLRVVGGVTTNWGEQAVQQVVDDWASWVAGGPEPGISGRANLETLALCEMVLRAARERRAVERSELGANGRATVAR